MTSDNNCQKNLNGNSQISLKNEKEDGNSKNNLQQNIEFSFLKQESLSSSQNDSKNEIVESNVVCKPKDAELSHICNDSWPSASWPDGSRRSAFQPYKPTTVLTNLQRGNTKTETVLSDQNEISLFEQAGLGDLTEEQTKEAGTELHMPDANGLNALMWAAAYGQTRTVDMLINVGANVNHIGATGETALLLAAAGGHVDVIKSLLFHKADVNHEDFTGSTALMYAAYGDHPHAVNELLIRGARFSAVNDCGDTAYTIAITRDSFSALSVLESHLVSLLQNEIS